MEWFSIHDRVPEDFDDEVLVAYSFCGANFVTLAAHTGRGTGWESCVEGIDLSDRNRKVTHWMRLPKHPAEGGGVAARATDSGG
jgi:hypothetical protein